MDLTNSVEYVEKLSRMGHSNWQSTYDYFQIIIAAGAAAGKGAGGSRRGWQWCLGVALRYFRSRLGRCGLRRDRAAASQDRRPHQQRRLLHPLPDRRSTDR